MLRSRSKRRGKRPSSAATDGAAAAAAPSGDEASKRRRTESDERPLTEYEREVRQLESRYLKDEGSSVRPLTK